MTDTRIRRPRRNRTGHTLTVPGRHEARALTDGCDNPSCDLLPATPVVVYDLPRGGGREAAYRCAACGHRWVCWWAGPEVYGA